MMATRTIFNKLRHVIAHNKITLKPAECFIHRSVTSRQYSCDKQLIDRDRDQDQTTVDSPTTVGLDPFSHSSRDQKTFLDNLNPPLKRSFNLAAYVNSSVCLQELVKLGVSLYDIENINRGAARHIVKLDFERDCVPYIKFLVNHGLKEKNLGRFISEYPTIFQVPIDELQIRLDFLIWRKFSMEQISQALNRSSQILYHDTKTMNTKLDELQSKLELTGRVMRSIVAKYPPVVSIPSTQYMLVNFSLTEEFGFRTGQMHALLEAQPQILDIARPVLIERLDLVHNSIGLSHETITMFPKLITGPRFDIKYRFEYLRRLKRDQFDPEKPLYVPPFALYNGGDEEFCQKYTKTTLEDYKLFVKSR